jgi:protein tyrosine/serine phosphatase
MGFRSSDATSAGLRRAAAWLLVALVLRAVPIVAVAGTPSAHLQMPLQTGSSAPPPAPREQLAGLPNFGVVSDQLYRGAQPSDSAFARLKALGIAIVVNLRHESGRIARERTLVENLGMRYVSIPWRGHDDPKTEQVAQFLRLLRDNPGRRVFVHCQRGAERTGVMVACYRISREQWAPERALAEMEAFGFRPRFAHLARFVREFPTLLLRDPVLGSTIRP